MLKKIPKSISVSKSMATLELKRKSLSFDTVS